jgi:hypothetical protein
MLLWLPMIVTAGFYPAMSDDLSTWRRGPIGETDRTADDGASYAGCWRR